MHLTFSLRAWQAYSPYHHDIADWQSWAKQSVLPENKGAPPLAFVPAMQRRRLNLPAKLMFAALYGVQIEKDTPIVFASHDGEINRSFALWTQLFKEAAMSPMSFGLAVHNALSGLWSLFDGNTAEMTAVSSMDAVLETGLLEAVTLLGDGAEEVVLVVVEEPLAEGYDVNTVRAPFPYALALRIAAGDDYQLEYSANHEYSADPYIRKYWSALGWIAATCRGDQSWATNSMNGVWSWRQR
ncbi:beta-ketoacyl synthase chain length factor [Cardiobacteriaceae bacterium TAE3-ERU3]|nr:beta-ketoacyl synthase chain length factor [Cardiobacteriaceae bacterium TAE3-ERU3]